MSAVRNDNSRFPFTSSQWQELEHQALVYKYMISGMPIPHDLLYSIKRSLDSSTKIILHHHSPHQSYEWNCFQMGFGRKIDPEPGRCRRTDGKKWRCSKDAYPDSKYCERHMHRGRNRSRKPVEANLSTNSTPKSLNNSYSHSPLVYPQGSSRSPANANVLSSQNRFSLESSPYSHSEKDHTHTHSYGMKEEVDEHPCLSESCGSGTISASPCDSWHLEPLAMNKSSSYPSSSRAQSKQRSFFDYQNDYSYLQLQNTSTQQQQKQDQGSCYDHFGLKIERKDEPQKVMHHFFDESPHKDYDDHNKDKHSSTTQLSISIPNCAHDFFQTLNDK